MNSFNMQAKTFPLKQKLTVQLSGLSVYQKKYEILLFSFLLLIFGNTFTAHVKILDVLNIYQNMIIGAFVFYNRKRLRNPVFILILLSLLLDLVQSRLTFINVRSWHSLIYLAFFFLITREVYMEVLYAKTVTRELLSAAMCGFVLLCLISTFLFVQIDLLQPHSFANAGEGREVMPNLNYFSFTTLLTIGYGDITPVSMVAKRAVMLMGLTGHFYTVFITSIIIGKYLAVKKT
jgi:voltage-gated potassium channel